MKQVIFSIVFLFFYQMIDAQSWNVNQGRFIEVSGSAEMEIEPDEIQFLIGIKEYWKEEFEKKKEFKDYKTKTPISKIEKELLSKLESLGIKKDQLIINEAGNYWRYQGKDFLISKQFEISLHDMQKVNQLINTINMKGIDFMRMGKLKHSKITKFRKEVKVNALKAAKEKAEYLLESIDKELGNVISIVELENNGTIWSAPSAVSNVIMDSSNDSGIENTNKIKLKYDIKARFEIR